MKKNLSGGAEKRKVGRKRRLVKKLRLVTEPITANHRRNLVKKLVPRKKEELMDASKWYDNWVPMTLEEYEKSYQQLQRRHDRPETHFGPIRRKFGPNPPKPKSRPPLVRNDPQLKVKTSGGISVQARQGSPPPRPPAPPVLSSVMSPPGPRRPPHPPAPKETPRRPPYPPPGHQETAVSDESQEVEPEVLSFSPEDVVKTSEEEKENLAVIPVIQDISNDINLVTNVINPLISSQTQSTDSQKPKREFTNTEYNSNIESEYDNQTVEFYTETQNYNPPAENVYTNPPDVQDEEDIPTFSTSDDYVSPTTAAPLTSDILLTGQRQTVNIQLDAFHNLPTRPGPGQTHDFIFRDESLEEKNPIAPNRRQVFLGQQIPILKQTTEMNQDEAHSFVFE